MRNGFERGSCFIFRNGRSSIRVWQSGDVCKCSQVQSLLVAESKHDCAAVWGCGRLSLITIVVLTMDFESVSYCWSVAQTKSKNSLTHRFPTIFDGDTPLIKIKWHSQPSFHEKRRNHKTLRFAVSSFFKIATRNRLAV